MDLHKLSYWEDIWKLRFSIEKCKVLHSGSKNIKVEYKLRNKEIKKVNEECDLGVDFVDRFKADNNILSSVSRANGMIDRMVRNSISRVADVV